MNEPDKAMPSNPALMVDDLDTFAAILTDWHAAKVKTLEHMKDIPAGSEVSFNDGPATVMEGPYLEGFKMGIELSLMELGTLPFFTETTDAELGKILDTAG